MTININNNIINVESTFNIVYDRLKQFEFDKKDTKNYIIINDNLIDINVLDYKLVIKTKIYKTDIYPILNNLIGYLINDESNLYIHSVVISKNNKGILLLGDFKAGKSSLALVSKEYGYEINSSDQTWIRNNKMILGSMMNKVNDEVCFLEKEKVNKNVVIDKILIIKGISTNGEVSITKLDNKDYYIKNIFKYANWHYDMPILSKYIKLKDKGEDILKFIKKLNIDAYMVNGDPYKIMEVICDREESIK